LGTGSIPTAIGGNEREHHDRTSNAGVNPFMLHSAENATDRKERGQG